MQLWLSNLPELEESGRSLICLPRMHLKDKDHKGVAGYIVIVLNYS